MLWGHRQTTVHRSVLASKFLLEHTCGLLFTGCLWLLLHCTSRAGQLQLKTKPTFTLWPFTESCWTDPALAHHSAMIFWNVHISEKPLTNFSLSICSFSVITLLCRKFICHFVWLKNIFIEISILVIIQKRDAYSVILAKYILNNF